MHKVYYAVEKPAEGISEHDQAYALMEKVLRYAVRSRNLTACAALPDAFWKDPDRIGKGEHGKPFLKNIPGVYFNISHCRNGVMAAVSSDEVGIDMQHPFAWKENLMHRMTCVSERELFLHLADSAKKETLLHRVWCRKESLTKCIGDGLTCDFRNICVLTEEDLHEEQSNGSGQIYSRIFDNTWYYFYEESRREYVLCICQKNPFCAVDVTNAV